MATPSQPHGPYIRWTRKVAGKTVSVRVRARELPLMKEWIENSRGIDHLITEMQKVSLRATEKILRRQAEAD